MEQPYIAANDTIKLIQAHDDLPAGTKGIVRYFGRGQIGVEFFPVGKPSTIRYMEVDALAYKSVRLGNAVQQATQLGC